MKNPMKTLISLGVCLLLAGCVTNGTELPDTGDDMKLKSSPCACLDIDYDGKGFEWTS